MNIAEQLHARQAELRNRMAMGIAKSFETDIEKAEETDLEKAHKDGDLHPNGKWVWVSSANGGKGDWRTINGKTHKSHTAAAAGVKSWDKSDSFNKKGSDENKLWNAWYKFQTSGDPNRMSEFRGILEKKFPNVATWTQTSPNTGKAIITAKDSAGKEVVSIDLSGDTILLTKLQTFMDKCHAVKPVAQAKTLNGNGDSNPSVTDKTLHNTLKEIALTGTIRNLKGVSQKRRGEILDELEKRGFIDKHMNVTKSGTAWLSGLKK